nr:MAG TPA: hypothetical protein [Caudoviricetes sp.]
MFDANRGNRLLELLVAFIIHFLEYAVNEQQCTFSFCSIIQSFFSTFDGRREAACNFVYGVIAMLYAVVIWSTP